MAMGNTEDDEGEKMGLLDFGAEEVDMNMELGAEEEGEEDEEDLDGGAAYARKEPREVVGMDLDTDVTVEVVEEEVAIEAVEEEEEEVDELDAFMSNVQAQVKNVDKQDKARLGGGKTAIDRKSKLVEPENEDGDGDDDEPSGDEVDRVGDSASDILACVHSSFMTVNQTDDERVTDWLPRRSSSEDENCTRSITPRSSTKTSARPSTTLHPRSKLLRPMKSKRCVSRWTGSRSEEPIHRNPSQSGVTVVSLLLGECFQSILSIRVVTHQILLTASRSSRDWDTRVRHRFKPRPSLPSCRDATSSESPRLDLARLSRSSCLCSDTSRTNDLFARWRVPSPWSSRRRGSSLRRFTRSASHSSKLSDYECVSSILPS